MRRELRLGVTLFCVAACGSRTGLEPREWFTSTAASGGQGGSARGGSTSSGAAGVPMGGSAQGGSGGSGGLVLGGTAGSAGSPSCVGGPRPEVCNGRDDDCDGVIDNGMDLNLQDGPVVVRLDEGQTDVGLALDCSSCHWAWTPQLVTAGGTLGMVWYLGVYGGSEQPNGFYRSLKPDLSPDSAVTTIGPWVWLATLRPALRTVSPGNSNGIATVVRSLTGDIPVYAYFGRYHLADTSSTLQGCSAAAYSDMVGEVLPNVVACASPGTLHTFNIDESGGLGPQQYSLSVRDNDTDKTDVAGRAVGALEADNTGVIAWPVTRSSFGKATELWTVRVNHQGLPIGDPYHRVLSDYVGLSLEGLFSTATGFLLFGDYRGSGMWPGGRFVVTLDQDGAVSGEPRYFDSGELQGFDQVAVTRDGTGFVLAAARGDALVVEQLDQDGSPRRHLTLDAKAYSEPSLLARNGSFYIGYAEAPDAQKKDAPNRVMALRLGCD